MRSASFSASASTSATSSSTATTFTAMESTSRHGWRRAVGGICISGAVREQVQNKVSISFADLGEQTVNIERPIHVYYVVWERTGARSAAVNAAPAAKSSEKASIAVLPFVNMSGDSRSRNTLPTACPRT